jgi:hypothetical protein
MLVFVLRVDVLIACGLRDDEVFPGALFRRSTSKCAYDSADALPLDAHQIRAL